jgi:FkbM family methyltransferase
MEQQVFSMVIDYPDRLEYDTLYEEVFKKHTYYVDLETSSPVIIDCGANIGMTTLYFHKQYPEARITCIEPNPKALLYLRRNLEKNLVDQVEIIPKALVGKHGKPTVTLYTHPSWTVFASTKAGGWTGDQTFEPIQVESIKLSEVITSPVDILKIDIEGMESEVIEEVQGKLHLVKHCLVEFHQTRTSHPDKILKILREHFHTVEVSEDPRKEKKKTDKLLFISASN